MKIILAVVLALAVVANAAPSNKEFEQSWQFFKASFGITYDSVEEEYRRQQIFAENMKTIESHNYLYEMGQTTYKMGINKFSAMTQEETTHFRGFKKSARNGEGSTFLPLEGFVAPKSVDWRAKGYVTPVKDQGFCGSCWTFSTTGAIEGQHFRKTNKLVSLSEQNLVDCDKADDGCSGGDMISAFEYVIKNKGIDTEKSYPYEAVGDECRFNKKTIGAIVTGHVEVPDGNETALMEAVATVGPIAVAIDANHPKFMQYAAGILTIDDCSKSNLDHAVLVVGYGSENGQDYWLVKNSWSNTWGEKGYVRMARNKDNMCGIATEATYPLV